MSNKMDIVVDKVDDICEKFEMEGLHSHPTYKQFKRLFVELEELRAVLAREAVEDEQDSKLAFVRSNTKPGQNISMADMKARYNSPPASVAVAPVKGAYGCRSSIDGHHRILGEKCVNCLDKVKELNQ